MSRVVFSKGADLDIAESIEWYNKQKTGLGDIFFNRLVEKIEAIEKNPLMYSIRYRNVHCAMLDQFPYLVHYIIETSRIVIIAVLHTKLNPRHWEQRIAQK
jgi:plasmid stabilization system protein ParE